MQGSPLRRALRPYEILFAFFAFIPFNLILNFRRKITYFIYWLMLVVIIFPIATYRLRFLASLNDKKVGLLVDLIRVCSCAITLLIIQFESVFMYKKICVLYAKLNAIYEQLLDDFNVTFDYYQIKLKFLKYSGVFTILNIIMSFLIISVVPSEHMFSWCPILYIDISVKMKCVQYCVFQQYLTIIQTEAQSAAVKLVNLLKDVHSRNIKFVLGKTRSFQEIQSELWYSTKLMDIYFGWSNVFIFTAFYYQIAGQSYWTFAIFKEGNNLKIGAINCVVSVIIVLFFPCWFCQMRMNSEEKVRRIICDIKYNGHNPLVISTMKELSLQMFHQKTNPSAGGFFNINCGTFAEIISSCVIYVVILIQFY